LVLYFVFFNLVLYLCIFYFGFVSLYFLIWFCIFILHYSPLFSLSSLSPSSSPVQKSSGTPQ
jgi:hypothetical protein